MMDVAIERIHGAAGRIGAMGAALPEWRLASGEWPFGALREYLDFRRALEQCKESAADEFQWIRRCIEAVRQLGGEVEAMGFPPFRVDWSRRKSDEVERQRQIHAQARQQFNGFRAGFREEFGRLEAELERTARESADFKVVLFGRTGAGKSTLREALTRGNGESIGIGFSSTTKECHEYTWRNLRVWDTPGIDSCRDEDGREERAALEKLETADLAIFICRTEQTLEVNERRMLERIVRSGRPYMILLNVDGDVMKYPRFKKEVVPEICRESQREFIDYLLNLDHTGLGDFQPLPEAEEHVIPIHAKACFISRARNSPEADAFFARWKAGRQEVYDLSNFGEFRSRLTAFICGEGEAARRKTIDRVFAEKTAAFFGGQKREIGLIAERLRGVRREVEKARGALTRLRARWTGSCLAERIASEFRGDVDVGRLAEQYIRLDLDEDEIQERWTRHLTEARKNVGRALGLAFDADMERAMGNLEAALRLNDSAFERIAAVEANGVDWGNALKWGGRLAGVAGGVLLAVASGPIGWVALGVGAVLEFFGRLFGGEERKIRKLRGQLRENLEANLERFREEAEEAFEGAIDAKDAELEWVSGNYEALEGRLDAMADVCRRAEGLVQTVRKRMESHGQTSGKGEEA